MLIIVLWVAFGLVALSLYFAQSMSFELRAADHRVAAIEAEQAIKGAALYVTNLLAQLELPGTLPPALTYHAEAVPVGDARVWLIGRSDSLTAPDRPVFGLVDEASKLNLNSATREMLEALPRMTPELAAAIIDWRDADEETTQGGAEAEIYLRRNPPYRCKNANFESVEELRLVLGAELEILYGEDTNLNGVLDPNENDGELSPPSDNRDGRLDPGLLEYLTVSSQESTTRSNGAPRIDVSGANQQELETLLTETFGADRANEIRARLGGGGIRSVLEFYVRSQMTREEFMEIEADLMASNGPGDQAGRLLVNVNTATETVLACIPGIGAEHAPALVGYRQSNPDQLDTLAWVTEVLEGETAVSAGPYLTGRTYQFTADVAAVGRHGRGYRRVKFLFDNRQGAPRIVYRQDLSHLGWALGRQARELLLANENRR